MLSLDPAAIAENATHSVLSNVYEGLVAFDRDMRLRPALAVGWSAVDERTWLVQIRRNARFHDGRPLTASDVKYSLDRARSDPASGIKGHLASIERIEIVDGAHLRLVTTRPDPLLISRLTYVLIEPATTSGTAAPPRIGTGPYRVVRWEKGKRLEVEAFADYWGGRPPIGRVEFTTTDRAEATLAALGEERAHVWRFVPESLARRVASIPGVRLRARPGLITVYLWLRSSPADRGAPNPFSNGRVRRAVALAIDRRELVARLGGWGVPAHQLVQQGVFGHVPEMPEIPFDVETSRRLLADSGYAQGFEAVLTHPRSFNAAASVVQQMLQGVGIRVRLEEREWSEMAAAWKAGQLPFFIAGWGFEDGDAMGFLRDCLFSRDASRKLGDANPGFSDAGLDRLIDDNDQILGEGKRLQHYGVLMRHAMERMPLVPLYDRYNLYAASESVKWEPRLDGKLLAAEMSWTKP